jgi:hypothetical protein
MVKRSGGRYPATIIMININTYFLVSLQAIRVGGIMPEIPENAGSSVITAKAFQCTDPKPVILVKDQIGNIIVYQGILFTWYLINTLYSVTIESVQSIIGSNPDKALMILGYTTDTVTR